MNSAMEHSPDCPRFMSFEAGDTIDTAPPCECIECPRCHGTGEYIFGDDGFGIVSWECGECDGTGRVLK